MAVFALVLAYVAVVAGYCALRTLARLRRDTHLLARGTRGPNGQQSLIEVTSRHAELTAALTGEVDDLRSQVDELRTRLTGLAESGRHEALAEMAERVQAQSGALRRVALVRYDAFGEMSGRMSFSLALLNDAGDGVTISAITGRTDTRVYAKAIAAGRGEHELSPEESQAVASALEDRKALRRAG